MRGYLENVPNYSMVLSYKQELYKGGGEMCAVFLNNGLYYTLEIKHCIELNTKRLNLIIILPYGSLQKY